MRFTTVIALMVVCLLTVTVLLVGTFLFCLWLMICVTECALIVLVLPLLVTWMFVINGLLCDVLV